MLRFKLTKFKQVCTSVLLPRLLLKNLKYPNEFNTKRILEQLSKVRKSTDSGSKNEGDEKQIQIIEKCFSYNKTGNEIKLTKKVNEKQDENIITPQFYNVKKCNKCDEIISKIFSNKTDVSHQTPNTSHAKLEATTSKSEDEKLTQKIEIIEETPHVEANAPKVEGFNTSPKVLGRELYNFNSSKQNHENTDNNNEQINLDELAKRCMGSPLGNIDQILTRELKNVAQNNQPKSNVDFSRNHISEDNYRTDLHLYCNVNTYECRFEKIQPMHLDSVPLLTLDTASIATNDYKESTVIKEYPSIVLTADVDEADSPATLSPYDKQAIPFYEYLNKENIMPDSDSKIETAAITEALEETEIIINDDTLEKEAIEQGHPSVEGETLNPKPNINQFTDLSGMQNLSLVEETNTKPDYVLNTFNSQRYFTSNTDQPTDWHSQQDVPQKDEAQNSSISGAFLPGGNRRTLDLPLNTAISANQNPEEFYNMSFPEEFVVGQQSECVPVQRIFAECPVVQNIVYSALPQIELEKDQILKPKDTRLQETEPEFEKDPLTKEVLAESEESVGKNTMPYSETAVPLSLLLKKIREQNRLEYCRNVFAKADIKLGGTKKFACPPPLNKNKPKVSVKPCPPKPKPACDPCKPTPCPPKKDPCAKCMPLLLSTFDVIFKSNQPADNFEPMKQNSVLYLLTTDFAKRVEELGRNVFFSQPDGHVKDSIAYARDFEPWIPIPSWPIPEKVIAKPFVCPKEGCKVPAAHTNKPCKEKQCKGQFKKFFALTENFAVTN